jgi:hypothetical protein
MLEQKSKKKARSQYFNGPSGEPIAPEKEIEVVDQLREETEE